MIKIFQIIVYLLGAAYGLFMLFKPASAIEMQRRFYAKINWRIEPISMPKELRNTKIMGVFLLVFALFSLLFISQQK